MGTLSEKNFNSKKGGFKKICLIPIILAAVAIVSIFGANAVVLAISDEPFSDWDGIDVQALAASASDTVEVSQTDTQTEEVSDSDQELIYPEYPYFIEVDITNQVVTIYTTSSSGKYDKVVRYMLCSTAQDASKFPEGYWKLKSDRSTSSNIWRTMKSHGTALYAQYVTQITGDYLFHSVPCTAKSHDALDVSRYNKLGTADSGGCIRLTVENAKWINENCAAGTTVHMVAKEENTALTEALKNATPKADSSGWDPTDPDPDNPNYQSQYTEPDPEPEGYLVENFDDITYSAEIPYVS